MDERAWHAAYDVRTPPEIEIEKISLPDMLRRTVGQFPDRPCLRFLDAHLTYRETWSEIDKLAGALARLGVGRDDKVAVHLPNLPQTVIGLFATLRLGAQAVMTNPLYVPRELEHQWNDADCRVALTADYLYQNVIREVRDRLPVREYVVTHIPDYMRFPLRQLAPLKLRRHDPPLHASIPDEPGVHAYRELVSRSGDPPPPVEIGFDDLAMLQYTGGTTGASKGAMLTHANLSANAQQICAWFPGLVPGREVILGALPFFHIFGITVVVLLAIATGAEIIILPNPRDIKAIAKSVRKRRVTLMPAVPAMFNAINNYPGVEKMDLRSVKRCFSGSAPLPLSVLDRFETLTGSVIVEGYGLTESSPVTHANPLQGTRKIGTIGVPISNTDARVVDVDTGDRELPDGEEGEVILRGPQIMKGYWNRPEDTAEILRDGWLFTGDLAARDEQGYFTIVGRKKDMILASGYNIYPDEIDRVLTAHDEVAEACTIGVPDPNRGETVKSFVVRTPDSSITAEGLIAYCRENLARYKVPKLIEFRDELPKSSMLKLLRRVLLDEELKKITEQPDHPAHQRAQRLLRRRKKKDLGAESDREPGAGGERHDDERRQR